MKQILLPLLVSMMFISTTHIAAQNTIETLFALSADERAQFAKPYLTPKIEGQVHSMNAHWFNTAKVKPFGGFEISVIASGSLVKDTHRHFTIQPNDFKSLTFASPDNILTATALGENTASNPVTLSYKTPSGEDQTATVNLPGGLGKSLKFVPTYTIQGAVGLFKGVEIKARYAPEIKVKDYTYNLYGAGLQVDFTDWIPSEKLLPVAISGLVAYTHLKETYDFKTENRHLETQIKSWLLQAIISTRLPIINFYGGVGYIKARSESDFLGIYNSSGTLHYAASKNNPLSVKNKISYTRTTLGTRLKVLPFFRISAEYHFSEFNTASLAFSIGFR